MLLRRIFAGIFFCAVTVVSFNVEATPPPPDDPQYSLSVQALHDLTPFLGSWQGDQELPDLYGKYHMPVYRNFGRVGNVVLFSEGDGKPFDLLNVIAYDTRRKKYVMYLPGYRHTFQAQTADIVTLERPNSVTMRWTVPYAFSAEDTGPAQIRTTVSVQDDTWTEISEVITSTGSVKQMSKYILKRVGPSLLDFSVPSAAFSPKPN